MEKEEKEKEEKREAQKKPSVDTAQRTTCEPICVGKDRRRCGGKKAKRGIRVQGETISGKIWQMALSCDGWSFLMNGMKTGVLLDGTKVGNKRMTLLQAHFHSEVWISVPRVVRSDLNG